MPLQSVVKRPRPFPVVTWLALGAVALFAMAGPAAAGGPGAKVQLNWKTCAGGSSVVTDAQTCYVLDLKKGTRTVVFEVCAGVNLEASLVVGGRASTLLCATVEVPLTGSVDAARQQAEGLLRRELEAVCRDGKCPLGAASAVGRFKFVEGAPKESRDALRK